MLPVTIKTLFHLFLVYTFYGCTYIAIPFTVSLYKPITYRLSQQCKKSIDFIVSFFLGFFVRRFRGIFFAMLNLALSMILFGIIVKSVSLGSTDGFGILAAASICPIVAVLTLGIYVQFKIKLEERRVAREGDME